MKFRTREASVIIFEKLLMIYNGQKLVHSFGHLITCGTILYLMIFIKNDDL